MAPSLESYIESINSYPSIYIYAASALIAVFILALLLFKRSKKKSTGEEERLEEGENSTELEYPELPEREIDERAKPSFKLPNHRLMKEPGPLSNFPAHPEEGSAYSDVDPFDSYLENFGLKANPFQDRVPHESVFINKDGDALLRVMRAIKHNQSSIILLVGPTGSGKSENADFLVRNLPESCLYWYNQIYGQSSEALALSILEDLDESFAQQLSGRPGREVVDTFNRVLSALPGRERILLGIFDQGEHFSRDSIEFLINSTNPHAHGTRSFTALILAVPRFEAKVERLLKIYDTAIRRSLVREYTRPFTREETREYIARALAFSREVDYRELLRRKEYSPFTPGGIESLYRYSLGHPSTLVDLCYLSFEIASESGEDVKISPEIVDASWERYPNKELHQMAVEWYRQKGIYNND